jgi:aminoglycoside/choline kinase family phosphotransferase
MTETALPADAAAMLRQWIGEAWTAEALPGDASFRRYFRIELPDGSTRMLAWYPVDVQSQLRRFLDAYASVKPTAYLPTVLHQSEGAALMEDVGDRTLYDVLHEDRAEGVKWYRKAITLLFYFQRAGGTDINPPFTAAFFRDELEMTREFYVEKLMGVPHEKTLELEPILKKLANNIARHPYVLCHRDYHGQNIHVFNDKLYLIDFQDMRMGPDTYDLASLLRDRGVARILGEDTEMDLVDYYAEWRAVGVPGRTELPQGERRNMRRRYFETLLQRSVKILGTFSKQPVTRGRMWYLDFIPPTIESVRRCIQELPEYGALQQLLPMQFDVEAAKARAEEIFAGES